MSCLLACENRCALCAGIFYEPVNVCTENVSAGMASDGQLEDEKSGGAGPPLTCNAEAAKCETDVSIYCEAVKLQRCNIVIASTFGCVTLFLCQCDFIAVDLQNGNNTKCCVKTHITVFKIKRKLALYPYRKFGVTLLEGRKVMKARSKELKLKPLLVQCP